MKTCIYICMHIYKYICLYVYIYTYKQMTVFYVKLAIQDAPFFLTQYFCLIYQCVNTNRYGSRFGNAAMRCQTFRKV